MPSLWPDQRESLDFCPQCSGTGKTRCPACSGTGAQYETRYDYDREGRSVSRTESVSCASCGGSGDQTCPRCGGSGGTPKSSSGRATAASYDDDDALEDEIPPDPYAGETEAGLVHEMERERQKILGQITDCRGLPPRLRDRWYGGLATLPLTHPAAGAELAAFRDEVAANCRQFPYGFSMVGDAQTLRESLNLLEVCINSLRREAERFQERYRPG